MCSFRSIGLQLYFVNLGGYDANQFTELHKNVLVVDTDEIEAKKKAVEQVASWTSPHRDYLHQVDTVLSLQGLTEKEGYYIHLEPTEHPVPFKFTCAYQPIGK